MLFDCVVCGVDPGPESAEAARQAALLAAPNGRLVLVAVVETEVAVHAGWAAGEVLDQLKNDSVKALESATRELEAKRPVEARLLEGSAPARFVETLGNEGATLAVVGTHGHSRVGGILLGSFSTTVLHDAPCAVLVSRPSAATDSFPARIVAGTDGSNEGETACAIAAALRDRFGSTLEIVTSSAGKAVDLAAVTAAHPEAVIDERKPVDALVGRSDDADLLVIGSRGLHGLRALGSVSERIAHEARCSVLVVR
jgi:nucleotide-binding universal stress UspA family protein